MERFASFSTESETPKYNIGLSTHGNGDAQKILVSKPETKEQLGRQTKNRVRRCAVDLLG
jgi:hypothetical protein